MEPTTDELEETIIRENPDGIWLALTEENYPTSSRLTICSAAGIESRSYHAVLTD